MSQRILKSLNDPEFPFEPAVHADYGRLMWVSKETGGIAGHSNLRNFGIIPSIVEVSEGVFVCTDVGGTSYEMVNGEDWKIVVPSS